MEKENTKEKQTYSVTFNLTVEDDKITSEKFKFKPTIDITNFRFHYKTLMDNFVKAYLSMYDDVSILRPATTEEKEKHIYVFKTDDAEDAEHKLYSARKALYEDTLKAFNYILDSVFPDIIYIDQCATYQQEYAFSDKTEDEIDDYKYDVEYITQTVRDNYDNLINMLNATLLKEMEEKSKTKNKKEE